MDHPRWLWTRPAIYVYAPGGNRYSLVVALMIRLVPFGLYTMQDVECTRSFQLYGSRPWWLPPGLGGYELALGGYRPALDGY